MKQKPESWQSSSVHLRVSALCRSTLFLLATSGIAGFLFGALLFPSYHVAVETGQVLAGLIPYPPDNPVYIYHLKAWSLTCQFSALLLKAGFMERVPSIILSGLLGMLFFQSLFFTTYAICRRTAISFAAPFFVFCSGFFGLGISYAILFLGNYNSFGTFGMLASALVLGLLGSARFRSGAFLLGLLPAIHCAYAIWIYAALGITALLDTRLLRRLFRYGTLPCCAGLILSALSFGWQHHLCRNIPYADPVAARDILVSIVRNFDYHRRPFEYLHPGELLALFGVLASAALLFRTGRRDSRRMLPLCLAVSFVMVNLAAISTHLDPKHIPSFALAMMFGRFINLNTVLLIPLLLGLLAKGRGHPAKATVLLAFVVFGIALRLLNESNSLPLLFGPLTLEQTQVILFGAIAAATCAVLLARKSATLLKRNASRKSYIAAALIPVLISLWAIFRLIPEAKARNRACYTPPTRDPIIRAAAQRKGLLLTSSGMQLAQLFSRRPLLLEIDSINGIPYAPAAAIPAARALLDIYGINLSKKPASDMYSGEWTFLKAHGPVWEQRSLNEWQRIREEYGVTDILTVSQVRLKLPSVLRTPGFSLYTIPPPEEKPVGSVAAPGIL